MVVIFGITVGRGSAGTGGLPIDSRFSTALAAAAFPTAFRFVIDTVETADRTEAVDGGRFGTGGNFFALVLATDDEFDTVLFRPAVTFEAVDAIELRLEPGTSDFAVLKAVEASLLVDAVETGRGSDFRTLRSFLMDSVDAGRDTVDPGRDTAAAVEGLAFLTVDATEGASDFGRSRVVVLPATLLLPETVDGALGRGGCGELDVAEALEVVDACEAVEGVRSRCETIDGACETVRAVRVVVTVEARDGARGDGLACEVDIDEARVEGFRAVGTFERTPDAAERAETPERTELAEETTELRKSAGTVRLALEVDAASSSATLPARDWLRLRTLARKDVMLAVSPSPSGLPTLLVGTVNR